MTTGFVAVAKLVVPSALKDVGVARLGDAIRAAMAEKTTLAAESLIRRTTALLGPGESLTDREGEVLALIVTGLSNAEIANQLGLPARV